MGAASKRGVVVGRELERAFLLSVLADVRQGRSRAVVVRGPAGIGKTALLDELVHAASALRIVRVDGLRGDGSAAWSGIRELVGPLLDTLACLPPSQATALSTAIGVGNASAQVADRFAVGAAVLTLLAVAAERGPILAVVDDFQWLDRESADALAFAARRLDAESIGVVIAYRDGEDTADLPPVEQLEVGPLDDAAARALLAQSANEELDPSTARGLIANAAGVPLALVELPTATTRAGAVSEPAAAVVEVYERRFAQLDAASRTAAIVAALHHADDCATVGVALTAMQIDVGALHAAESVGLLDVIHDRFRFRHPLARSAIRSTADPCVVRRAHAALAEAVAARGDDEVRVRHLASATEQPDERIASMLEDAAADAHRRGALIAATELAIDAARVSPLPRDAARRRVLAVALALLGGRGAVAGELLDGLDVSGADAITKARAAHLRGRHFVLAGRQRKAMFVLKEAAESIAAVDPCLASIILAEASAAASHGGELSLSVELATRARDLAGGHGAEAALAAVALGAALAANGRRDEAGALLSQYAALLDQPDLLSTAVPMLMAVASGLVWLEQFGDAIAFLDPFIAHVRRVGAVGVLPLALVLKGWAHQRASQTLLAEAALLESIQLAEATGQETIALQARATISALYCSQVRGSGVRMHAQAVRAALPSGAGGPRIAVAMSLGGVLLHEGRPEDAVRVLREVADPDAPGEALALSTYHAAFVNLADAHVRLGDLDEARRIADLLERVGRERSIDWTLGHAHRLLGMVGPDDEVDHHFEVARQLLWAFPGARSCLEVSWGERLREAGRNQEAGAHLASSLKVARDAGVLWWTDRALLALRSSGEAVAPIEPPAASLVTSDELTAAVAYLRVRSVPETAAELFLSPQTVDRRVAEVYRKLGVHTPDDLADRLGGRADPAGTIVRVLGPLSVQREGLALAVPNGVPRRLLEVVAVEGRVHVDVVTERLWPDEEIGVGRGRLRNVLARLRASLGDLVVRDGDALTLSDDVIVDAHRFETATRTAGGTPDDTAVASAALRWYRGDLLPEAAYAPWAAAPRERLRRRFLRVLDELADDAERHGDWAEMARLLELGIESEPYDEDRYARAAEARLRQHRRSTAAALVRRARAIATELDVSPSARLLRVEAELAH